MILEESKPQNSQVKMSAATTEAMELAPTALKSLSTKSLRKSPYVEESSNHPHSNVQTLWMKAIDLTHLLKKKRSKISKKKKKKKKKKRPDQSGLQIHPGKDNDQSYMIQYIHCRKYSQHNCRTLFQFSG